MNLDIVFVGFFFFFEVLNNFKYSVFQFCFFVYNSGNGIDDIWNFDYVWLSNEFVIFQFNIIDVAFIWVFVVFIIFYISMFWRYFDG